MGPTLSNIHSIVARNVTCFFDLDVEPSFGLNLLSSYNNNLADGTVHGQGVDSKAMLYMADPGRTGIVK